MVHVKTDCSEKAVRKPVILYTCSTSTYKTKQNKHTNKMIFEACLYHMGVRFKFTLQVEKNYFKSGLKQLKLLEVQKNQSRKIVSQPKIQRILSEQITSLKISS